MKPKLAQPVCISPVWFFAKIGIICALGAIVFAQVYSMFWKPPPVPQVSRVTVAAGKASQHKQVSQSKREQTVKAEAQTKSPAQPKQQPLTKALMNPERYALIKGEFTRRLDAPYGKLYRELGLDVETLQKLRGLLAEKELSLAEGFRLAEESKMPLSAESLAALRADGDAPIRELLGEEAYANYKYYESTLPARNHANALEERLSYKSEPLTGEQYKALVSALSALPDPNIKPDSGAWLGNYTKSLTKETLEAAVSILTPSQFAVYQEEYDVQTLGQEMEKKYSQRQSVKKKSESNK